LKSSHLKGYVDVKEIIFLIKYVVALFNLTWRTMRIKSQSVYLCILQVNLYASANGYWISTTKHSV